MNRPMLNAASRVTRHGLPYSPSPLTNSWFKSIHDLRLLGRPSEKRMGDYAALSRGVR